MKPVIEFYNGVAANLPDHNRLKNLKLPGTSVVLDGKGDKFAELFESDQRRVWVPLDADSGIRAAGVRRRRGQAVLPAQGHRRARPDPRLHHQHRRARPAAGRLDHHPAGRQEPPGRRRRQLRAQDPRDDRGLAHRPVAEQGRNPRDLSQLDLSRPRRLGHRHRGAQLLQEAGVGADA